VLAVPLRRVRRVLVRGRRTHRRLLVDPPVIRRYLAEHPVRKLQLGAGPNPLPGWLNSDLFPDAYPEHRKEVVFVDAARPLPFADMTFDYVFSEHMIEHIPETDAVRLVRECFRVMRAGGRIRLATPNLAAIVGLYKDELDEIERHYVEWVMATFRPDAPAGNPRCYVINQMFNAYGHEFIYDEATLSAILTAAGFVDVVRCQSGESDDPALRGVESHGQSLGDTGDRVLTADEEVNRFETVVLEATRPGHPDAGRR
jgi:predicted SAM-dependent methyltransferase